jgi:hypothetical protein
LKSTLHVTYRICQWQLYHTELNSIQVWEVLLLLVSRSLLQPQYSGQWILPGPIQTANKLGSESNAFDLKLIWNPSFTLERFTPLACWRKASKAANVLHFRHCHPFHDDTPTNWTVLTTLQTEAATHRVRQKSQ